MKKIGIYSGTFDPVHNGHIAFALEAVQQCGLEKVYLLVEPRPRRKQGVKAFEHRIAMAQIAVTPYDQLGLIILDQARFSPRDTLPPLLERFKGLELCMLIGDDMLDHLASWPHVDELTGSIQFIIGIRKYDQTHVEAIIETLRDTNNLKINYRTFKPTEYQISSSSIKSAIKKRFDYSGIDPDVVEYIESNNLYYSDGE